METLGMLLADIDELHRDRDMDIRHHDRFVNRLERRWPDISRAIRRLMAERAPRIEGAVSYLGSLEHVRQVGGGVMEQFPGSEHAGVLFHLSRNGGQGRDYRLMIAFTEPTKG